jgi:thymidylate synthase ThyX
MYVSPKLLDSPATLELLEKTQDVYANARRIFGAEARQVIPLGVETQLYWTINARALLHFLRIRLCKRNMLEMQILAEMTRLAAVAWFPELFNTELPQPACLRENVCDQGLMSCTLMTKNEPE